MVHRPGMIQGQTLSLTTGSYTVTFKAVEGYTTPVAQPVSIANDQTTTVSAEYFAVVLPDETQGVLKVITSGTDAARWSVDGGTTWYQSGYSLLAGCRQLHDYLHGG